MKVKIFTIDPYLRLISNGNNTNLMRPPRKKSIHVGIVLAIILLVRLVTKILIHILLEEYKHFMVDKMCYHGQF